MRGRGGKHRSVIVDDEVLDELRSRLEGPGDAPSRVLGRLLGLSDCAPRTCATKGKWRSVSLSDAVLDAVKSQRRKGEAINTCLRRLLELDN